MDGCKWETRKAQITVEFEVCEEHGTVIPGNAMFESEGVSPMEAMKPVLLTIEQAISQFVGMYPPFQELVNHDYPDMGELPDRAKHHIACLFAHQYILTVVANRQYAARSESALLQVPFDPSGD